MRRDVPRWRGRRLLTGRSPHPEPNPSLTPRRGEAALRQGIAVSTSSSARPSHLARGCPSSTPEAGCDTTGAPPEAADVRRSASGSRVRGACTFMLSVPRDIRAACLSSQPDMATATPGPTTQSVARGRPLSATSSSSLCAPGVLTSRPACLDVTPGDCRTGDSLSGPADTRQC